MLDLNQYYIFGPWLVTTFYFTTIIISRWAISPQSKAKWLRLKSKIKAIFNGLGGGGFVAAKHP
jgi:threonine/homoserine/homoserine lactone efflux protein